MSLNKKWDDIINHLSRQPNDNTSFDDGGTRIFYNTDVDLNNSPQKHINEKSDFKPTFFEGTDFSIYDNIKTKLQEYINKHQSEQIKISDIKDMNKIFWDYNTNKPAKNYFWNESVSSLISLFIYYFNEYSSDVYEGSDRKIGVTKTNGDIKIMGGAALQTFGIKYGDAANSFVEEQEMYENLQDNDGKKVVNPWVIPWYNIDRETYLTVRNADKNSDVLKNAKELQFTRDKTNNIATKYPYLRLIMPKNKRNVEIEDLNRNFWVIGQTIASISAFLFEQDSSLIPLLEGILNEILQLWENTLLLWAMIAIKHERYYDKFHCEVVHLDNSEFQPLLKYDDFTKGIDIDDNISNDELNELVALIKPRINRFINEFKDYNIAVAPSIRLNNYEDNRYSKIFYPGIFIFNRNKINEDNYDWEFFPLKVNNKNGLFEDITRYTDKIFGISEDEDYYYFSYPFSGISELEYNTKKYFYGLLREQCDLNVELNKEDETYSINCIIGYYDAAYEAVMRSYDATTEVFLSIFNNEENREYVKQTFRYDCTPLEPEHPQINLQKIYRGYYQGEVLSTKTSCKIAQPKAQFEAVPLQPLVSLEEVNRCKEEYSSNDKRKFFPYWKTDNNKQNKYNFVYRDNNGLQDKIIDPKPENGIDWIDKNARLSNNTWIGKYRSDIGKNSEEILSQYRTKYKNNNSSDLLILMGEKGYNTGFDTSNNQLQTEYYILGDDNKIKTQTDLFGNPYHFNNSQGIGTGLLVKFPLINMDKTFSDFFHSTNYFSYVGKNIKIGGNINGKIRIPSEGSGVHNYQCELFVELNQLAEPGSPIEKGIIQLQIVSGYAFKEENDPVIIKPGLRRKDYDNITNEEANNYLNTSFIPLVQTFYGNTRYTTAIVCGISNISIYFDIEDNNKIYDFVQKSYQRYYTDEDVQFAWNKNLLFYQNTDKDFHNTEDFIKYNLSHNTHGSFFSQVQNGLLQTSKMTGNFFKYPNNGAGGQTW